MKKLLSIVLAVLMAACIAMPAFAEDSANTGTLSLVNYNVAGLPIPPMFSDVHRDPLKDSKIIPGILHDNFPDAEVICVQEDFNFHGLIKKGMNMPYSTITSGYIPWGDGLNFYSSYPFFNIHREAWEVAYGIFDNGADELTPKGFMAGSFMVDEGVYIDVYVLHADANDGEDNPKARHAQYEQVLKYIDEYSKDHAVIITGDFNSYFSETENNLYEYFVEGANFKEAWIECNYDGIYDTLTLPHPDCHKEEWNHGHWGIWDSAEKMFYRSGKGIDLEALESEYRYLTNEEGVTLSDHAAQYGKIQYTIDRSALNDTRTYEKESIHPLQTLIYRIRCVFKTLGLMLSALPGLIFKKK